MAQGQNSEIRDKNPLPEFENNQNEISNKYKGIPIKAVTTQNFGYVNPKEDKHHFKNEFKQSTKPKSISNNQTNMLDSVNDTEDGYIKINYNIPQDYDDIDRSNEVNPATLISKAWEKGKSVDKLEVKNNTLKNYDNKISIKTNNMFETSNGFNNQNKYFLSNKNKTYDHKREFTEFKQKSNADDFNFGIRKDSNEKLKQYSSSNSNFYKSNNIRVQTAGSASKRLTIKDL